MSNSVSTKRGDSLTLDSHIDIPWPDQPGSFTGEGEGKRQATLLGMQKGQLNAGCFVAFTPQGRLDSQAFEAAWQRCCKMLSVIIDMASPAHKAVLCVTPEGVNMAYNNSQVALIPVVENAYPIGEDIKRLELLAQKGIGYITLTHNGHNQIADSAVFRPALGEKAYLHHGLSDFGREVIQHMNNLGIMVDVSHGSKHSMEQAVQCSEVPVVASHSCIRALSDHPRNMDDSQLDLLRETGGVIQITALDVFLRRTASSHNPVNLSDLVAHIAYAVNRVGIEHVGISSDFEGGGGIQGWQNTAETQNVTAALENYGFDPSEIRALWGENFLRVWRQAQFYSQEKKAKNHF
ncbi:dipeptidase [Entomobacter blattae]|uniref:Membrane dipeptidase n=1 Tax=Entomobacter blattae TaxID=2762277 RepID=A0A7H1NSD4_9PROT|nr:dipeptidase [Entomobacter blattae]QNT78694.1 Membrane dipeptidase [Entomobacter blattae]